MGFQVITDLGKLVKKTYDQALMSSSFALAAKFDLSQYDMEVQSALLSSSDEEFGKNSAKARRALKNLREDLDVFRERALEEKSVQGTLEDIEQLEIRREALFAQRGKLPSANLVNSWREDKLLKKAYRSLTAEYDDAAVVGYKFRLTSEEEITSNTKRSLLALGASIVGSLILSLLLSYLIISPLSKMKSVCHEVAEGNFVVRANLENKDEFGLLADSFNIMLDNIEEKRENMASLLTTIPFALFYFDQEGQISTERSKATDKIFPEFTSYTGLEDFFKRNGFAKSHVPAVLNTMFSNAIPFKSAADLLPQVITTSSGDKLRTIRLSYQAKRNTEKKLEKVIILGEDITEKEQAKAKTLELTERVERVSKVSTDVTGFKEFLPEVNQIIADCIYGIDHFETSKLPDLKRNLHTLKGILGVYSFHSIARKVHHLESEVEATTEEFSTAVPRMMKELSFEFQSQSQEINKLLNLESDSGTRAYEERKIDHIRKLAEKSSSPELVQALQDLEKFPVEKVFAKYAFHAQNLAQKLGEKSIRMDFEPSDEVTYDEVRRFDSVLVHLINNSVDHGIETMDERSSMGKDETGIIRIGCHRNPQSLVIRLSDDGKGIDGDRLLEKARSSGLISGNATLSHEEKLRLVFASGLSSKAEVSEVSGRGIGMDAVKTFLEEKGGTITLQSIPGTGTTFEIQFPNSGQV
ncbi:MAG: ATP-binding protein [Bdellovibrionota bacterium]